LKEAAKHSELFFCGLSDPNRWFIIQRRNSNGILEWQSCFARPVKSSSCFEPIALIADGTFDTRMNHKNRTSFEIAAMVAMILGGVWKRHAVTLDENEGGRLQYVPWY